MSEVSILRIQQGEQVFNVRAAAAVLHDGYVLLHRAEGDNFWSLPGGRVQMGETGEETTVREMQEEVGVTVTVERMLFFSEEFFDYNDSRYHEMGLFYLATLPADAPLLDKTKIHEGIEDSPLQPQKLLFKWFPLAKLADVELPIKPGVLVERLQDISPHLTYIYRNE
jgi:ADP-ribose pyrophosphatase YjhB (NUDIX family)